MMSSIFDQLRLRMSLSTITVLFGVSVFQFTIFSVAASFEISTFPETTANIEKLLPVKEGSNYTIICNVTTNGVLMSTEWFIQRQNIDLSLKHIGISPVTGVVEYPAGLSDQLVITGPVKDKFNTFANQFLIKSFTHSFHICKLQCGTENYATRRKFILGVEVAPNVQNNSATFIEGLNVSIILNISGSLPGLSIFPPLINYTNWRYNGEEISSDSSVIENIAVGEYCINFTSVSRHNAGIYSLSVSNGRENSTGYFKLEIYYPLVATAVLNDRTFAQTNENVTLVAFNSSTIDGWPTPNIRWIHPDGRHINASTGRYIIDIPGEITIINIKPIDNGTYHCIIYNGVKNGSLLQKVHLVISFARGSVSTVFPSEGHIVTTTDWEFGLITPSSLTVIYTSTLSPTSDVEGPTAVITLLASTVSVSVATFVITLIAAIIFIFLKKVHAVQSKRTVTNYTINEAYASVNPAATFYEEALSTPVESKPTSVIVKHNSQSAVMKHNPAYASTLDLQIN